MPEEVLVGEPLGPRQRRFIDALRARGYDGNAVVNGLLLDAIDDMIRQAEAAVMKDRLLVETSCERHLALANKMRALVHDFEAGK